MDRSLFLASLLNVIVAKRDFVQRQHNTRNAVSISVFICTCIFEFFME